MEIDVSKLKRDAAKVHAVLKELPDNTLVTTKGCTIVIPARFAEKGLASIGIETQIVGIYAIVAPDGSYGVSMVNAMMKITPTSTTSVKYGDDEYYEFYFEPGSTVVADLMLLKVDTLVFKIYEEILAKARVPWYIGYEDLAHLFDSARYHGGANIGENRETTELIVSMIARDSNDRMRYYRQVVKAMEDLKKRPPAFIPMRSVQYNATNTTTKIMGSYLKDGMISAINNPADRTERLEDLLRR